MAKPLELFLPTRAPFVIGQHFGESLSCTDHPMNPASGKTVAKVNGVCPPGFTSLYEAMGLKGHNGLDIRAAHGEMVYACCDGVVMEVSTEPERGCGVGVLTEQRYDLGIHGEHYFYYRYWHALQVLVTVGQRVKVGDPLILADSTGLSSGDHCHWEGAAREYDEAQGWYNVEQDNGYTGKINIEPFLTNIYAHKIPPFLEQVKALIQRVAVFLLHYGNKN